MASESTYKLSQDKKGVYWDLLLYIPTIVALLSVAFQLWFSGNQNFTYLLVFLTTFVFLIGFNRIFKTRLMLLSSAPVGFAVSKKGVTVKTRGKGDVELSRNVRFFSDFAGKSIALTGMDLEGKRQQFVFHRGQFDSAGSFDDAKAALRIFK